MNVNADSTLLALAVDSIFSYMIRLGVPREPVLVRLEKAPAQHALLFVSSSARMLAPDETSRPNVFEARLLKPVKPGRPGILRGWSSSYLVKEIILRSNGKIWLESQPGKGTELHLMLPLSR